MNTDIKILLVDDFKLMLTVSTTILNSLGFHQIQLAHNGREAWERLQQEPFDLLMTDWDMPEMNGGDLINEVRKHPELEKLPILVITGDNHYSQTAMDRGANAVLLKPFKESVLRERLEELGF